jgi:hypothetical protein
MGIPICDGHSTRNRNTDEMKTMDQIFISHSSKDRQIVGYFVGKFDDTGVKPVLMEVEKWSISAKPNWLWIRDEIKKSRALFLLLTKNIIRKLHTQNWVAFEIGLASMCIPSIPVFVFREENVNFPVPYLNHYFDEKTSLFMREFSETLLNVLIHTLYESFIDELIKNPSIGIAEDETIKCSKCLLRFHYWGANEKISCLCCSTDINTSVNTKEDLKDVFDLDSE